MSQFRGLLQTTLGIASLFAICVVTGCNGDRAIDAVISGGSMAPLIAGEHFEVICADCQFNFKSDANNVTDDRLAVCPNCGYRKIDLRQFHRQDAERAVIVPDDQIVDRWDVVAFAYPNEEESRTEKVGVKRVVALPGERMGIDGGDILINGEISAKPLSIQREVRIPVFDSQHFPQDNRFSGQLAPARSDSVWTTDDQGIHRLVQTDAHIMDVDILQFTNWRNCRSPRARGTPHPIEDYYAFQPESHSFAQRDRPAVFAAGPVR